MGSIRQQNGCELVLCPVCNELTKTSDDAMITKKKGADANDELYGSEIG